MTLYPITPRPTPIGDILGDPEELLAMVQAMSAAGEEVPELWTDALEGWAENNDIELELLP